MARHSSACASGASVSRAHRVEIAGEPRRLGPGGADGGDPLELAGPDRQHQLLVERHLPVRVSAPSPHQAERGPSEATGIGGAARVAKHGRGCVGRLHPVAALQLDPSATCEQVQPPSVEAAFAAVRESPIEQHVGDLKAPDRDRAEDGDLECPPGVILETITLGELERALQLRPAILELGQAHLGSSDVRERVAECLRVVQALGKLDRLRAPETGALEVVQHHPALRDVSVRHRQLVPGRLRFEQRERLGRERLALLHLADKEHQA